MSKSYYFIFGDDSFDRDKHRGEIARTKRQYNKMLYDMNRAVEELDRYDDFDALKISNDKYARTANTGAYGIPYDASKHVDNSVIFKHQSVAAGAFLKDLRGFGLLADVVGSGKTFEAALILSELAVRGKLKSMLLVVPGQVYDGWIDVLEMQFGLGKGVLFEAKSHIKGHADFLAAGIRFDKQNRPDRPIIVKMEDFASWDIGLASYLFDVIVVDEAHHLCKEEGEYAKAMKLLSMMMQTKKRANTTYCLLLSATPHSGNLVNMFRLWYFIRCKGGNPNDFDEKDESRLSEEYKKEKEHYLERVCRGATTVMEFIKRVKKSELLLNYSELFNQYLLKEKMNLTSFKQKAEGEQQFWVDAFLALPQNADLSDKIMHTVANAYHNGVLRSIMIRQPSTELVRKKKSLVNYLYYPAKTVGIVEVKDEFENELRVDVSRMNGSEPSVMALDSSGWADDAVSLAEYVEDNREYQTRHRFYSHLISNIFAQTADSSKFNKQGFVQYYREQMFNTSDRDTYCELRPLLGDADLFEAKFEDVKNILRKHAKERVLIFFDYELKKKDLRYDRFLKELQRIPEFSSRIVVGTANDKERTLVEFDRKDNAVLVIKDASFTEGVNLQSGNVIINFQVTPDPLAMDQRIGRVFRLGQKNDVTVYSLAAMNQLEGFALMYFVRIGLMSSNSGDATIIAGSNNDRMVAVRCDRCGQVKLYSREDYETYKKNGELYCLAKTCVDSEHPNGILMKEISVYDFQCDRCSSVFVRSVSDESGYMCMANTSGRSVMCNRGEKGDRRVYCRKICAMAHCRSFYSRSCPAVNAYMSNKSIGDQDLYTICSRCPDRNRCPEKCRPYVGTDGISACSTCSEAICRPKPHVIEFDDHWEAECPVCKGMASKNPGRLRPVVARTFAAYLRASWDFNHDNGKGFCENLLKESNKVTDIKLVLDADRNE